jgi:type IV pilus assembly protein PilA
MRQLKTILRKLDLASEAFTLVELLIVIAIIGVLAAIIIPNVTGLSGSGQAEAAQAEAVTVQTAMDTMITKLGLTNVTSSTSAVSDMSHFPDTLHPLYPDYLRSASTNGSYSCDSSGKVTQVSTGYSGSAGAGGGTTPAPGGSGGTTTDLYVSGADTLVAAALTSTPSLPLNIASYTWANAQIISSVPSQWTSIAGANWISTTSSSSGQDSPGEGDAWRLFKTTFVAPAHVTSAKVYLAADNAFEFYLNGNLIASSNNFSPSAPVYEAASAGGSTLPFTTVWIYDITPVTGTNNLTFVVRNWNSNGGSNPTGLIYKVTITH